MNKKYTDEFLISELQRFVSENGKVPTAKDFENNKDFPSGVTYQIRFGSWNNGLKICNFDVHKRYTDEELLNELHRFIKEYGKVPTARDFDNDKKFPNSMTYINHFGTWNNALIEAGLHINKAKLIGNEYCMVCGSNKSKPYWYYKNGKRICNKCYCGNRNYFYGTLNPDSNMGIGIITEHIVREVLNNESKINLDCITCNTKDNFNADYDLISEKYGTINVKSSKLYKTKYSYIWEFHKTKNSIIPNNYICIGFDKNRNKILKVWIINGNSNLVTKRGIYIANSKKSLMRATQYEVDSTLYNEVYQNLDITTLPEFRNINYEVVE